MTVTADLLAVASQASYNDSRSLPADLKLAGFVIYETDETNGYFRDIDTGFGAQVWHNPATSEYIVALRGTDITSPKDWYTNVQLGKPQFFSVLASQLKTVIGGFNDSAKIHFTGHSLGGALAQYFASEFASSIDQTDIALTTFNSLGGMALFDQDPSINVTAALSDITATHYVIPGDAVSRLGNGHLGGNVREINLTAYELTPIEAHAMSLFIDLPALIFDTAPSVNVDYLSIDTAQAIASAMAVSTDLYLLTDDGQYSNVEASARMVAGLAPALLEAPDAELISIVEAFFPNNPILLALAESVIELRPVIELVPAFSKGNVGLQAIATVLFFTTQKLNDLGISNADIDAFTVEAASLASSLSELALAIFPGDNIFSEIIEQGSRFYQYIAGEENSAQLTVGKFEKNDVVRGEGGDDTLYGLTGDDVLRGNGGRDRLYGNEGADHLYGGEGNDFLSGGEDAVADFYYYKTGDGHDTIIDADLGGDRIHVNGTDLATLTFVQLVEGSNSYRVEEKEITLLKGTVESTIFIGTGEEQGSITLNAYSDGSFGINLQDAEVLEEPAIPDDARVLEALGETVSGAASIAPNYYWRDDEENSRPIIYSSDDYYSTLNYNTTFFDFAGTFFADRLIGANDNVGDFILGLDGDDYIDGGDGADFIEGNAGSDMLFGGADTDTMYGDTQMPPRELLDPDNVAHEVAVEQNDVENHIDGEAGDDYLIGGKYVDIILGGEGEDILAGNPGNDILSGGADNDVIFGDSLLTWEFGAELSTSEYEIIRAIEYINSTESNLEYADFIDGGAGDDVIFGEVGDDIIHGGKGQDILFGDRTLDDPDGELIASLNGKDTIFGGDDDDEITGGGNDDLLHGGAGDDLILGDGDSIPEPSQGDDVIYGGAGDDELNGGGGEDRLAGGAGSDTLFGGRGKDRLFGGAGADELTGGQGDDQLWGDAGSDLLLGDGGDDRLYGGRGDDQLQGGEQQDLLVGGKGNDALLGEAGDDILDGGAGADNLFGGDGDDTLNGGGDVDYLEGGGGSDTYVFATGDGGAGVDDTSGAITLHFDGVASLGRLRLVQNDTHTTLYFSTDQSDWVSMTNATYNQVTHVELGSKRFHKGQLAAASPIIQTGSLATEIAIGLPDLRPEDVRVFGQDNGLVINIRQFHTGPGKTGIGQLVGVADWFTDNAGNFGDIHFTDALGNIVGPDNAENLHLDNWYLLDPNDRIQALQMPLGAALGLSEDSIDRTFTSQFGQPVQIQYGTAVDDRLLGSNGPQDILGQDGNDVILGMAGDDTLHGGNGHDQLEGGAGEDTLHGDANDDTLLGGGGSDYLHGGAGDDVLYGGEGGGSMHGGAGDDAYVVDSLFNGVLAISDVAGTDRITFAGIAIEEVYFDRDIDDLNVWVGDNRLVIDNVFDGQTAWEIEEWVFTTENSYRWIDLVQAMNLNIGPVVNAPLSDVDLYIDETLDYLLLPEQFVDPDGVEPLRYSYKVYTPDFVTNLPPSSPDPEADPDGEGPGTEASGFGHNQDVARWLAVDSDSGTITARPELVIEDERIVASDIGEYRIQYHASDRLDGDGISEFAFNVLDEDPAIDPRVGFENVQVQVGEEFSFTLPYYRNIVFDHSQATVGVSLNNYLPEALWEISSIDDFVAGDDLSIAAPFDLAETYNNNPVELPGWLAYDGATRTLYGTPGLTDVHDRFDIHIWLSNGGETFAFKHSIEVSVEGTAERISLGDDFFLGIANNTLDIDFGSVLANDMHWEGANLSLVNVVSDGAGLLDVDYAGGWMHYTPAAGELNASLSYQVSDATSINLGVVHLEFGAGVMLTTADDEYSGSRAHQRIAGHLGDDSISGKGGNDKIAGGGGADTLRGNRGNDHLWGGPGDDRLVGGAGDDLLYGNGGNDLLRGGEGNDTYYFDLGDGAETLNNISGNYRADIDALQFMSRLAPEDLWFSRRNDHLIVDIIGSDDSIKLKNWYRDDAFRLDAIKTADYGVDMASLDQLVQAMAAFSPPRGVGAIMPAEISAVVLPEIAASWLPSAV